MGILELCLLSYQATSFSILELLHHERVPEKTNLLSWLIWTWPTLTVAIVETRWILEFLRPKVQWILQSLQEFTPWKAVDAALSSRKWCLAIGCLQNSPTLSSAPAKHQRNLCGNEVWIHLLLLFSCSQPISSLPCPPKHSQCWIFCLWFWVVDKHEKMAQAVARTPSSTFPRGFLWCQISLIMPEV